MAKEAEMMCAWMSKNNKPVDFSNFLPDEIVDSRIVRHRTLNVMIDILEESSTAAAAGQKIDKEGPASRNGPGGDGDGDGITADGAANTTGGGISDVLNSEYKKKIEGGEKSKIKKEDLFEKLWGWERLLPLSGSVKWADYRSYLEEYYKRNASEFVAGALANQNPEDSQISNNSHMGAALAKSCLKMEEELFYEWKTRVKRSMNDTLQICTIIQSSLIKELALSVCSSGGELFAPFDVSFVMENFGFKCITKEADLMCELLKHGAKPFDDIIEHSSVIRMCALGLANLKGHQSIAVAAAMVGMAKEAKKMCDWIKREKKLVTLSLCEPHDLEECHMIRIRALDVMTSILHDSSFPCPKVHMLVMFSTIYVLVWYLIVVDDVWKEDNWNAIKSLIQPAEIDELFGGHEVKSCRVHDTVLDFIVSKAVEENFVTIIGVPGVVNPDPGNNKVRRLSLQNDGIGKLLYLNLRFRHARSMTELPEELARFQHLEIDIHGFNVVMKIPEIIQKQLVCYVTVTAEDGKTLRDEIASIQGLRVLKGLPVYTQSIEFLQRLGSLKYLKKLSIQFVNYEIIDDDWEKKTVEAVSSVNERAKASLESLHITIYEADEVLDESWFPSPPCGLRELVFNMIRFTSVPEWMGSLVSLEKLSLFMDEMGEDDVEILGALPSLRYISIESTCDMGPEMEAAMARAMEAHPNRPTLDW
ncbi:hypothetical protein ACQ4PT_043801 [Festuca glaucescens]